MRAREFLIELFDQPYSYTWIKQDENEWRGNFTASDKSVVKVFFESPKSPYEEWDMAFIRNESTAAMGGGDEFKIFSTVLDMLSEFILAIHLKNIVFYSTFAATGSRMKLYDKLVEKYAEKLGHGYTYSMEDSTQGKKYVLTRNYQISKDFGKTNEDKETLELPDMVVGDEVKVGRFKNRKAEIKGFKKDDKNQPVLKTTKGDQKLFKPRISKLEPDKKLDETFDQPYSYTWDDQSNGAWRGGFTTKTNDEVEVNIENWQKYWKIEFSRNDQYRVTGSGDAIRIFATVMAMIDEFMDIQSPDVIKFLADKSKDNKMSRAKLYSRMIKRFAAVNGYNSQESITDGTTVYLLTRKEDKNESI